jgi:hypothetical protein
MRRTTSPAATTRTNRNLVTVVVAAASVSCLATLNGVIYEPAADAPVVAPRAEGCAVEIVEHGTTSSRANHTLGHIRMEWSTEQMRTQGHDGALKSLKAAACERGAHLVLGLRVLPRTPDPGVVYDADLAVLLDETGKLLQPKSMAEPAAP